MLFKRHFIWYLTAIQNGELPRETTLPESERTNDHVVKLCETLFPGVNVSILSLGQFAVDYAIPVLKLRFPQLLGADEASVANDATVDITEFQPTAGWQWMDDGEWTISYNTALEHEQPVSEQPPSA